MFTRLERFRVTDVDFSSDTRRSRDGNTVAANSMTQGFVMCPTLMFSCLSFEQIQWQRQLFFNAIKARTKWVTRIEPFVATIEWDSDTRN